MPPAVAISGDPRTDETPIIPRPVENTATGSIGRAGSLKRQQSTPSDTASRSSSNLAPMQAPHAASALRSRRQSRFPPNSFNNGNTAPRAPRKSVGPGTFAIPDPVEISATQRRPSVGVRKSVTGKDVPGLLVRPSNRSTDSGGGESIKSTAAGRTFKAKSFQSPKRKSTDDVLTGSRTPDAPQSSSTNASRTLGKSSAQIGTPSSSMNNRRSIMLPYATGLGAKTISPTDAQRSERLSVMPKAPPMPAAIVPQTPNTSQPDPPSRRPRSTAHSPALNSRKSVTPSSSGTTPDPNRKSYSSGQSLSSSTSYNSARNSSGPLPRLTQGVISSSRKPTPKPRLDSIEVDGIEEVPPVPAIPKAFESPQSELEQPFFSAHSSGLPHVDTPISLSPTVESLADAMAALETPRDAEPASCKSSRISDTELRIKPVPPVGRKGFQPLRLPPINLLPLSTPTAAKILALQSVTSTDERILTPPPRQTNNKTPSTPMTASRVNFSSRTYHDNQPSPARDLRSSSSHHVLRGDLDTLAASNGVDSNIPCAFGASNAVHRNISPYISSSLPKCSGEFPNYMQHRPGPQTKPTGQRAPSLSSNNKQEEKLSPNDAESPFSASATRQKLSLTRTSKTSKLAEKDAIAKYNSMPPPRIPASATWGNLAVVSRSPTQKQIYHNSRRKTSNSSFNTTHPNEGDQIIEERYSPNLEGRPSMDSKRSFNLPTNQSSSAISSPENVLSPQRSSQLRPQEVDLDREDPIAEEEMKKLAAERRDGESAAEELDALRRRARLIDRPLPSHVMRATNLNIFERGEVVDYKDVYFTGACSAKKIMGDLASSPTNFGYDDERGDYKIVMGDHLAYRYEVVDLLGKGSFGQVVRCIDHKTGILVAVKIIRNKKRFHQQALVEVDILRKLREWDPNNQHSVVKFIKSFYFRGHFCIATELLDMNLYEFIKAHEFRGFSLILIRRFTKQLLSSLALLNGHKVIHCDLKPENILLTHPMHSEIKVIDFGSSCFEDEKVYTYIQSRFYRSPEVILGMSYGMPIDMWSLGCILAELYTGCPIFPGENEQKQLACIMEVFGPPEKHLIERSSRKKLFFDSMGKPRWATSPKGRRRRSSSEELRQVLKCDDEAFLDFLAKCLRWDPSRRLNPQQAMEHEFVTGVKSRRSQAVGSTNTPIKRLPSITAPSAARPLPQLPSTSLKNGVPTRRTGPASNSPSKPVSKRHSTINGPQPSTAKRASLMSSMASGSILLKATQGQRSMSGRPDLASVAAAAAAASSVR